MAITDELRKWWVSKFPVMDSELHKDFTDIASRIDAEHERETSRAAQLLADAEVVRDYNYSNWQDCKQKVLQHNITMDELSAEIERLKDELVHHIELPKDADGEVIHVGDKLDDGWRALQGEVRELILNHDGWWFRFKDNCERFYVHEFHEWHHHKQPTVEDVLREFTDAILEWSKKSGTVAETGTWSEVAAEYAAKLRLVDNGKAQ